jgi:hypothetical protein
MSEGFSKSYATSAFDDPTRFGGIAGNGDGEEDNPRHELDSLKNVKLLSRLREWYDQEWRRQAANRYQMALDEDYYDSMQWTAEDAQVVMDRNQAPLVYNEIKPTIDWVIGTERRTRIDHKVLPRKSGKEAADDADSKTQLLKYLSDTNKTPFQRSIAFESAIKAGVGWLETGIRGDPTDELGFTRCEDWRNIIYDGNSVEYDGSDMRFIFRSRWIDDDIAQAYFPDRAQLVAESIQTGHDIASNEEEEIYYMGARVTDPSQDFPGVSMGKYHPYDSGAHSFTSRARVKLTECWYKVPVLVRRFVNGDNEGEPFDSKNKEHVEALRGGYSLYDKLELEVRCAIYCNAGLLFDGKSPYRHGRIPFVPIWCYRRKRDNAPYGMIRPIRDPQDDLNKRASKALWLLSTNRVIADEGAVDDWDDLREEVARPDSIIIKRPGKELRIERDIQLAEEHMKLMERDVQHIRNVGGVTAENLGRQTNADSGKAITARQDQGGVVTTAPFDNLRFAVQLCGEMEISNIEQFYTEAKTVRIVGDRGGVKFKELNQEGDNGEILNDITKFHADYVVSEQDYRSSLRQAMFESLFDIVGRLAQMNPQVALNLLDLVVEMADLPNKDELVQRIRKINGQSDPDKEMTPEEQAQVKQAEAAQQQMTEVQQQIALETMQNQLAKLVAETGKLDAQAMSERIQAIYAALQAAGVVATVPGAAAVADEIMKGAGYQDATVKENAALIAAAAEQQQNAPPQDIPALQEGSPESAMSGANQGIETPEID